MPKIPHASEVAASLGQAAATTPPPRPSLPRVLAEERAEIVRSIRFTRPQIEYMNRIAGEQTAASGRSVSISEVLRQFIDEKRASAG